MPICLMAEGNILVLRLNNGTRQFYDINEPISIRTSADSLFLTAEHLNVSYSRPVVAGYNFSTKERLGVGIKSPVIPESSLVVTRSGNMLTLSGICSGSRVRIFATNGIEVAPSITYNRDASSINLSTLSPGVYIVHVTGCKDIPSIKITR